MMRDIDLDVPRTDGGAAVDETKRKEKKLANKLFNVKVKLKKAYNFTVDQIHEVFNKNTDHDGYFYDQIIRDVEQQYAKIPMGIPIDEYLYETLMNIESLDMEKRQQEILSAIPAILDGKNTKVLSYMNFLPFGTFSEQEAWKGMKEYVKNNIQDFFVIHVDEDMPLKEDERSVISCKLVRTYLSRTWKQGMNFYVFVQKDGVKSIAIGTQKGSTGRANDTYFGDLAKKYNATKVTVPLSHFMQTS